MLNTSSVAAPRNSTQQQQKLTSEIFRGQILHTNNYSDALMLKSNHFNLPGRPNQ